MVCHALSWCERASLSLFLSGVGEHKELCLTEVCVRTYTVVSLSLCTLCLQMLQLRTEINAATWKNCIYRIDTLNSWYKNTQNTLQIL